MDVRLRYFDGCPNWRATNARLLTALRQVGAADVAPVLETVRTPEEAERLHFRGSPTVLIDGDDPFPSLETSFGLTCRIYSTPDGPAGSPTIEQLREALARRA